MLEELSVVLEWMAIIGGGFFMLTGAMGLLRFPDFFTRIHAVSVAESLGIPLLLIGAMLHVGAEVETIKLVLLVIFMLITGPTATHALAKAAFLSGVKPEKHYKGSDE